MAELAKYHLSEQRAAALLRPIRARLREDEARTRHYLSRLHLAGPADQAALEAARQALSEAARAVEALVTAERPS